jgi:hypothetical protein
MMASNQPFGRVDDGIGAGLISGAVVGGAFAGGLHTNFARKSLKSGARSIKNNYRDKIFDLQDKAGMLPTEAQEKKLTSLKSKHKLASKLPGGIDNLHNKAYGGGWKGKAVAYGGSVLAAGLIGAGLDSMND